MNKEAMKLALEALENGKRVRNAEGGTKYQPDLEDKAITALREAMAEHPAPAHCEAGPEYCPQCHKEAQPAQQHSTCSNALRIQGKAYPRTCKKCGLGPCVELANIALDKMAENARELGLDYEPAQDGCVVTAGGFDPRTQRTWVGLTDDEKHEAVSDEIGRIRDYEDYADAIEAKLRSKNENRN